MKVTLVLDSGCFLTDPGKDSHVDVGYFESDYESDITATVDGKDVPINTKLGKGNSIIEVQHLAASGDPKTGTVKSASFDKLLTRRRLYPDYTPPFVCDSFDCTLRFHSGDFAGVDIRDRVFKECVIADNGYTEKRLNLESIPNDVEVTYQVEDDEALRIARGKDVIFSTDSIKGAQDVRVVFHADAACDQKYYKTAFDHKGTHCWLPNPDPPPVDGE
jgi:hypothetical protein